MPDFPEGEYVFEITGSTGTYSNITESITFTLNLINPCPISYLQLNDSPFPVTSTYVLRDKIFELDWVSTTNLAYNQFTSARCGEISVFFY